MRSPRASFLQGSGAIWCPRRLPFFLRLRLARTARDRFRWGWSDAWGASSQSPGIAWRAPERALRFEPRPQCQRTRIMHLCRGTSTQQSGKRLMAASCDGLLQVRRRTLPHLLPPGGARVHRGRGSPSPAEQQPGRPRLRSLATIRVRSRRQVFGYQGGASHAARLEGECMKNYTGRGALAAQQVARPGATCWAPSRTDHAYAASR